MFQMLRLGLIVRSLCSRRELLMEILVLRQQLAVFKARRPRPRLTTLDRVFWVMLLRFWSGWKRALVIVQPDTVVRWHRAGFKLYWTWRSRHKTPAGSERFRDGCKGLRGIQSLRNGGEHS